MANAGTKRWRPNWVAWGLLVLGCVVLGFGLPLLHSYQSQRITERIRRRAVEAEKRWQAAKAAGDDQTAAKSLAEVVKNYDSYLRHRPGDTDILVRLALAVFEQADHARENAQLQWNAYRVLARAVSKVPTEKRLLEAYATVAMRLRQWDEAASVWNELWQRQPKQAWAGLNLAGVQIARQQTVEAVETLRQVVQVDPSLVEAWVLLARCYRDPALRDNESAEAAIDEMVAHNSNSAVAYAQRAAFWWWVYQTTKNPAEAERALALAKKNTEDALAKSPRNLEALLMGAELAMGQGQHARAGDLLKTAEQIAPADRRVWTAMVKWARFTGDTKTEEEYLTHLAATDPSRLPDLAEFYLSLAPPDLKAAADVVRRMQRAQFAPSVLQLWQRRLAFLEQPDVRNVQALEQVFRDLLAAKDPLTESAGLILAEAYARLEMTDSAGAVLSQLRDLFPDSPRTRLAWARWLAHAGREDVLASELQGISELHGITATAVSGVPLLDLQSRKELLLTQLTAWASSPPKENAVDWQAVEKTLEELERSPRLTQEDKTILRARYLSVRGQWEEAISLLTKAAADSRVLSIHLELANLYARQQRWRDATDTLQKAEKTIGPSPELFQAMLALADKLPSPDREKLIDEIASQIAAWPAERKLPVQLSAARALLRAGELAKAEALYRQIVAADTQNVEALRVLLELACARRDFTAAEQYLAQIRRIEGPSGRMGALASALLKVHRARQPGISPQQRQSLLREAETELAQAEQMLPYWPDAIRLQAEIFLLQGRFDMAIDQYRQLQRRGLLSETAKAELTQLLLLRGQPEEAAKLVETLPAEKNDPQRRKLEAEVLARRGKLAEAVATVQDVIASSSEPLDWLWYAGLLARSGRAAEADAAFSRVLELAPDWPDGYIAQMGYFLQTQRRAEAEKTLAALQQRLGKELPPSTLALGYELLGRVNEAETLYREAIQANPGDGNLWLDWAGFCLRHNRLADCRSALERIIKRDGGLQVADATLIDARRNLAQLIGYSPDYREFRRAEELLQRNIEALNSPTDRCLLARLLARRPERSAKQRAVDLYSAVLQEGGMLSQDDRFALAQALVALKRWSDARLQLLEVVRREDAHLPVLAFFAGQLIENGSPAEEIDPYLERLRARSADMMWLELKTRLAVRLDRPEEVVALWTQRFETALTEKDQAAAESLLSRAEACGLKAWTEQSWQRLVKESPAAQLGWAMFLGRQGRLEEALAACQEAAQKLPAEAVATAGVNILKSNRARLAADHLDQVERWLVAAQAAQATDRKLAITFASFLNLAGKTEQAIGAYRQLLHRPDLSDLEKALIQNNLAYLLAARIDPPAARDSVISGSSANRPDSSFSQESGSTHSKVKLQGSSRPQSAGDYTRSPSSAHSPVSPVSSSSTDEEYSDPLQEADQLIDHALQVLGPLGSLLDTRAVVRLRQGRSAEALQDAQQSVLEEPSPLTYFHLVEALIATKDVASALREWQRATRDFGLNEAALPPVERPHFRQVARQFE